MMLLVLPMLLFSSTLFAQNFDVYANFEAGSNGQALTAAILNAGTPCNTAPGGSWSVVGDAAKQMAVSTSAENNLLSSIQACGTTFAPPDGTRGITYNLNDGGGAGGRAEFDWTRSSNSASLGIWVKIGVPTTDTDYHSMLAISDGTGDFVSLMIQGGNIYLESGACPNETPVACGGTGSFYAYTANVWYWVTEKFQKNGTGTSMHMMNIYDASGNLLSAQTKPSMSGDLAPDFISIGKIGDTGSPNVLISYDNFIADLDDANGAVFPILVSTPPAPPTALKVSGVQ